MGNVCTVTDFGHSLSLFTVAITLSTCMPTNFRSNFGSYTVFIYFLSIGNLQLELQLHKLEVSFATLQRLSLHCADPAYPIRPQCGLVARGRS